MPLEIDQAGKEPLSVSLSQGETLFVLGANGTGKSNLMQRFFTAHRQNARWISAHRQTWFESGLVNLTPQQKQNSENSIKNRDVRPAARWRDYHAGERPNIAVFNLVQKQSAHNTVVLDALLSEEITIAEGRARKSDSPLAVLNDLLRLANLPITISVRDNEEVMASKPGSQPYSIAELSDGERNVTLIAAEVLTVPPGTLILTDEPERHLHRSIISPLLTGLFSRRPDCQFVISTHEVMLPFDNPSAKTLLTRGCTYEGKSVVGWDVDLVDSDTAVDEQLKKDILGARRTLLFVEGEENSLDSPLYTLIFPDVTVVPKGSRKNVEHAVTSIRDSEELHWIKAYGIVDSDGKTADDIQRLNGEGIYPIDTYSVESIYYHPKIQEEVAKRRSSLTGDDPHSRIENARTAAIAAVKSQIKHLIESATERKLRVEVMNHLPNRKEATLNERICIQLDAPNMLEAERGTLNEAIASNDLDAIMRRYPVRETSALSRIATCLGFSNQREYEKAVLQLLKDNGAMLRYVRELLGGLSDHILAQD